MAISSIDIIMGRIEVAALHSPIAVFKVPGTDQLEAVFASTVAGIKRLERGSPYFVGVFDKTMPKEEVRKKLTDSIQRVA